MTNPATDQRPWRCPGNGCRSNVHDHYSAYRQGCRSGAALEGKRLYEKRHRLRSANRAQLRYPAHHARRRLQALHALGYSWRTLAEHLGWCIRTVRNRAHQDNPWFSARNHARVLALYSELAMVPPTGPNVRRAQRAAARLGWALPLAWDDIDDPDATPVSQPATPEKAADGGLVEAALALGLRWDQLSKADREELLEGLHHRRTEAQIADYLHTTPDEIKKTWDRILGRRRRHEAAARLAAAPQVDALEQDDDHVDGEQEDAA